MRKYWKKIALALFGAALIVVVLVTLSDLLTFEALKKNSHSLARYAGNHRVLSLLAFGIAFLSTAFFVPGALVLTVMGGFLFGTLPGALLAAIFSTAGAALAFLTSRYLIGSWVQERYALQLRYFNKEMARYGSNYLFVLRIVPIMPAFVVNYLSGLTRIEIVRFAVVTFCGIFPGALIYAMAGSHLAAIERPEDILSPKMITALSLLALLALAPVLFARLKRLLGASEGE